MMGQIDWWEQMPADRRALAVQIVRYGAVGLGVTLVQAAVYWVLATPAAIHAQIANFVGYLAAVASGYVLHGRYTFAGTARPAGRAEHAARGGRFVIASLVSLGFNALWVWICVSWQRWPTWTPIPAFLFITPALLFVLNKKWVFR